MNRPVKDKQIVMVESRYGFRDRLRILLWGISYVTLEISDDPELSTCKAAVPSLSPASRRKEPGCRFLLRTRSFPVGKATISSENSTSPSPQDTQ